MTSIKAWLDTSEVVLRDAEILVCEHLGLTRAQLLARPDLELTPKQKSDLDQKSAKLLEGMPLAYILGEWEFWGLTLNVNEHTLVPRPDTELLVELAIEYAPRNGKLADLGTGSGAIAIAIAKERPDLTLTATDIDHEALEIARANARRHSVAIEYQSSHWFGAISDQYNVIVSNPPYIALSDPHLADLGHEPQTALVSGMDGLDDIRLIANEAPRHLKPNGLLLLEHGYDQGEAVRELFKHCGFKHIATHRDLGDNERVTQGQL